MAKKAKKQAAGKAKKTAAKNAKSSSKNQRIATKSTAKSAPKKAVKKAVKKVVKKVVKKSAKPTHAVKTASQKAAPKKVVKKVVAPKKKVPATKAASIVKKSIKKAVHITPKKVVKAVKKAVQTVLKKLAPKANEVVQKGSIGVTQKMPSVMSNFPKISPKRPIAHIQKKSSKAPSNKTSYNDKELAEFQTLILDKLEQAKSEFSILKDTLNRANDQGTDATGGNTKVLEDGAETLEKENISQLAARQLKYITNLENALIRIKNKTYGICSVTGKLIPKQRLIAVPHTTRTIEAKLMNND